MENEVIDGIVFEYESSGEGEPVVFIHGVLIADAFQPMLRESRLASGYRLINYHRRGYVGSGGGSEVVSISRQAADCQELLHFLGAERAHVVGHSYGGSVALQLALDAPEVVQSLALLEPALFGGETGQAYRESLELGSRRYGELPPEVLVNGFLEARLGQGYEGSLEQALAGAFDQAVAGARTTFTLDIPSLLTWSFGEEEAGHITQPMLNVLGGKSEALWPRFGEVHRMLPGWFPQSDVVVVPNTAHFIPMENPSGMAVALADFWEQHPIANSRLFS